MAWRARVRSDIVARVSEETRICRADELADGKSMKFRVADGERSVECFVVRYEGALHAYVNECRHVAMTLDWVENQFFTEDGDYLLCPTHGAWYLPNTGECVAGPPCGKLLHRVPLIERDGEIYALSPQWG